MTRSGETVGLGNDTSPQDNVQTSTYERPLQLYTTVMTLTTGLAVTRTATFILETPTRARSADPMVPWYVESLQWSSMTQELDLNFLQARKSPETWSEPLCCLFDLRQTTSCCCTCLCVGGNPASSHCVRSAAIFVDVIFGENSVIDECPSHLQWKENFNQQWEETSSQTC